MIVYDGKKQIKDTIHDNIIYVYYFTRKGELKKKLLHKKEDGIA